MMSDDSTNTVLSKDEFGDYKKKYKSLKKIQRLPRASDPAIAELIKSTLIQLASAVKQLSVKKTPETMRTFQLFKEEVAQKEHTIINYVMVLGDHPPTTEKQSSKWI